MKLLHFLAMLALPAAAGAQSGVLTGDRANMTRIAEPAAAQAPTSARLSSDDVARITTIRLARCMLQRNRRNIVPALLTPQFGPHRATRMPALASSDCLSDGVLTMPSPILRGAYFTVLYRDEFRSRPPVLPSTSDNFHDGAAEPFTDAQRQWIALRQFADCVARRDPAAAHAAVFAEPGSHAEVAAFRTLAPHLSACLASGVSLRFSRAVLSGLFAEVMYRQGRQS